MSIVWEVTMRIGGMPDLHLRATAPANRVDDYYQTQFDKLRNCWDWFNEMRVDLICLPGDIFNNYGRDPHSLVRDFLDFLGQYQIPILIVFGQHDLRFHDVTNTNTPAQVLLASGNAGLLHSEPRILDKVHFYGQSWGELTPKPQDPKAFNVLVCHKMIVDQKIWEGQKDYAKDKAFLRTSKFDLIISGDNHRAFSTHLGNVKWLFNCGSLLRSSANQQDHEPQCFYFDTKTKEYGIHKIPIRPFEEVMRLDIPEEEQSEDFLRAFVSNLQDSLEGKFRFRENLAIITRDASVGVKNIIERSLSNGPSPL